MYRTVLALIGCLVLLSVPLLAQVGGAKPDAKPPATAPSRVVSVTVYQGTALVTREVDVPAGQGLVEVVVTPLPPYTVDSSLYTEGGDGNRVLSTRYRTRAVKEDTRAEVRTIQDQIKKLEAELQRLQKEAEVADRNSAFVSKIEDFTAVTMKSLMEKGTFSADATLSLGKYVMANRAEIAAKQVDLQQQIRSTQEAINFAQRQLNEVSAGSSRTERDAVIVIDKANNAAAKVSLNYIVSAATWKPKYKFRAGGEKDPIQMEYLAAIEQRSGEDWTGAEVTLSTAQPMLNAAPPELLAMEVTVGRPVAGKSSPTPALTLGAGNYVQSYALRQRAQQQFNSNDAANANSTLNTASALTQTDELLNPGTIALSNNANGAIILNGGQVTITGGGNAYGGNVIGSGALNLGNATFANPNAAGQAGQQGAAQQNEEAQQFAKALQQVADINPMGMQQIVLIKDGPSVTYHLKNKLTIPSRNDEQLVEVGRVEFAADYFYKAVPVLASHVYRLANLTNKSDFVLLPGEATMYTGKDFVGRMNLPLVAIGEQFVAGFGVDPQVQVTRQLVGTSRGIQGANQTRVYDYRLRISSYKSTPIKLQLWDRLPKADAEAVGVNLVKVSPDVSTDPQYAREDRPDNLLRWDLTIEPGTTGEKAKEITYQFRLEYARDVQIGNFKPAAGKAR